MSDQLDFKTDIAVTVTGPDQESWKIRSRSEFSQEAISTRQDLETSLQSTVDAILGLYDHRMKQN